MAEIFGYPIMGGGGNSSGGTLTVTGVAGSTVTVSNADKSYTRTLDSTGKAIFKGLASGTWTVTMTNGSQTATRTVEITADYSVSIVYFAATINVTYPAGSMCTATDGVTTLTAPDTTGTWECIVPNAGTWTINCTDGSLSTSRSISITAAGETKTLTLSYTRYLYVDGDKCENVTGGWNYVADGGTVSFGTDYLYMAAPQGKYPYVYTVNEIALAAEECNTLCIDCVVSLASGNLLSVKDISGAILSKIAVNTTSRGVTRLDVSSVEKGIVSYSCANTRTTTVYRIWVE